MITLRLTPFQRGCEWLIGKGGHSGLPKEYSSAYSSVDCAGIEPGFPHLSPSLPRGPLRFFYLRAILPRSLRSVKWQGCASTLYAST